MKLRKLRRRRFLQSLVLVAAAAAVIAPAASAMQDVKTAPTISVVVGSKVVTLNPTDQSFGGSPSAIQSTDYPSLTGLSTKSEVATPDAATYYTPQALKALGARGQAMAAVYGPQASSAGSAAGLQWGDDGIVAGIAAFGVLLIAGLAITLRSRTKLSPA